MTRIKATGKSFLFHALLVPDDRSLTAFVRWRRGMAKKILVVDGSEAIRQSIRYVLEQQGYQVQIATDTRDGLKKIQDCKADLAIVEYSQTIENDKEFFDNLKKGGDLPLPVLALVPESQNLLLQNAKKAGVDGWILKPFSADALLGAVKQVMDSR